MIINRKNYLDRLIRKQWNGMIKVITGIRRCGKSTLLLKLFRQYLLDSGVPVKNIITLQLDDDKNEKYRDPAQLSKFLRRKIKNTDEKYYILLDEIQYAISKEELRSKDQPVRLYSILNGLLHMENVDVYVTGSNSKMLSKDISTEFRGRGDKIQIYPFSFKEYYQASGLFETKAYELYQTYGGMPYILSLDSDEEKYQYLSDLFEEIYFKDIEERYTIFLPGVLRELTSDLCSSVGSLTNASKISRTIQSTKHISVTPDTISTYLDYLTESFLFNRAYRYDVKGKKYFEYPSKYYCTDIGLRNVRLGLRQQEETHIMENIIYNELLVRGYAIDVGVITVPEKNQEGKTERKNCEIDFVARKGNLQYYIQSAYRMDDPEKSSTELRPLLTVRDSFKKIVISQTGGKSWYDDNGILRIGLIDFLLDEKSLDR